MKKIAFIVAISLIAVVGAAKAYDAYQGTLIETANIENAFFGGGASTPVGDAIFGASGDSNFTNVVAEGDLTAGDDLTVTDDVTIGGNLTIGDQLNQTPGFITATTTLTSSSESIQFISASANMITITLPAVTSTGTMFRVQVAGALTGTFVLVDSAEGDNIDGSLIVAGAVVVCDDEDQINIITDGEVPGDYVEFVSTGTQWLLVDSGVTASGKMTCTDPT